jgi:inner membrane transporter RhtA
VPGVGGLPVSLTAAALVALPFGAGPASVVVERPGLLIGASCVALLQTIFPYVLELNALRRIPTRVFGILVSLNPAAAALAGLVVLDQQLGAVEIAALGLVTVASAGVTLVRASSGPPAQSPRSHPSRESPASDKGA